jgi:hypothetical protein
MSEDFILRKKKFILGCLYILIVAEFMMCFELYFFANVIAPQETETIKNFVKENNLAQILKISKGPNGPDGPGGPDGYTGPKDPKDLIGSNYYNKYLNMYFKVLIERENILVTKINSYLVAFIIIEIAILFYFIMFLIIKLKVRNFRQLWNDTHDTIIYALITVFILGLFQVNMYFFALEYKYTSKEEIIKLVYDHILQGLKK